MATGTKVRTGGNRDDDGEDVILPGADTDGPTSKTRKGFVTDEDFEFSPGSLVGSWMHTVHDGEIIEQGVVVAEPQPGIYLVQMDKLAPGAENVQIIVTLRAMAENDTRFYDSENEARSAYAMWVGRKERV